MELDDVVKTLINLGLVAGCAAVWRWWRDRKQRYEAREVADIDKVRSLLEEDNEQKEQRIRELETFMTSTLAQKDVQLAEHKEEVLRLRADVASCQHDHAESRVLVASLTVQRERDRELIEENRAMIEDYVDRIADLETSTHLHQQLLERRKLTREEGT